MQTHSTSTVRSSVQHADLITIEEGYRPGLIGQVTEIHARFYSQHSGFGAFFERQVATGMAEFVSRLDQPCNNVWMAIKDGKIVGSVSIDGQGLGNGEAHLRWFIIDDSARGAGVGRSLLNRAMVFCDRQGFTATQLWTFKGLNAARRLYEDAGFVLNHEEDGEQWGDLTHVMWTRP